MTVPDLGRPVIVPIADDPLATIKRRPSIRDVKDSEVLWLVAEVDELRAEVDRLRAVIVRAAGS